jgi:uncharacterized protein (DUF1697 family)
VADVARHAAFLRGLNLGARRVKMDELRARFEELGLEGVATFIASGNVVFEHSGDELGALERTVEGHLEAALGYPVATFVRSMAELEAIAGLPVTTAAREEGFRPHVIFLREEPGSEAEEAVRDLETADDRFHAFGRELLWLRRGRLSDAPFTTRELERALGGPDNTMRNLNTIDRMVVKFGS